MAKSNPKLELTNVPVMYPKLAKPDRFGNYSVDILLTKERAKELFTAAKVMLGITDNSKLGPWVVRGKDGKVKVNDDGMVILSARSKTPPKVFMNGQPYTGLVGNGSIANITVGLKAYELSEEFKNANGLDYDLTITKYLNKMEVVSLVKYEPKETQESTSPYEKAASSVVSLNLDDEL